MWLAVAAAIAGCALAAAAAVAAADASLSVSISTPMVEGMPIAFRYTGTTPPVDSTTYPDGSPYAVSAYLYPAGRTCPSSLSADWGFGATLGTGFYQELSGMFDKTFRFVPYTLEGGILPAGHYHVCAALEDGSMELATVDQALTVREPHASVRLRLPRQRVHFREVAFNYYVAWVKFVARASAETPQRILTIAAEPPGRRSRCTYAYLSDSGGPPRSFGVHAGHPGTDSGRVRVISAGTRPFGRDFRVCAVVHTNADYTGDDTEGSAYITLHVHR
jgi:hypothetical protein